MTRPTFGPIVIDSIVCSLSKLLNERVLSALPGFLFDFLAFLNETRLGRVAIDEPLGGFVEKEKTEKLRGNW